MQHLKCNMPYVNLYKLLVSVSPLVFPSQMKKMFWSKLKNGPKNWKTFHSNQGCKHTIRGIKIVITLYCFLGVPCLSFNHVIIMKDFDNVFAYYVNQNPKKSNVKKIKNNLFCMM